MGKSSEIENCYKSIVDLKKRLDELINELIVIKKEIKTIKHLINHEY